MLTGNKDVDRKILNELDDKDLVKACQVNKHSESLCNDQVFWMNRVFNKFGYVGGDVLRKYKGDRSWSDYYIKDLRKITNKYLQFGSEMGRFDYVIIALKNGADVHQGDDRALRFAVKHGHLNIVKYLVENGADIHGYHDNPLKWAVKYGHLDIVKYLVEKGADIHVDNNWVLRQSREIDEDIMKYILD